MRVFHFRDREFGLRSIEERRLKIARIMELNDPFEFLAAELSNRNLRRSLNEAKEELSRTKGLICFSRNWQNPVQWSHYADHHRGICLGFDIPDENLAEVDYVPSRIVSPTIIDEATMRRFLATKFEHWSYEEEYRSFFALDPEEEENGLYFANFSDQLQLRTVIIGGRCDITRSELASALGELADQVESFKARPAFQRFEVVRNRNEALWA